MAWEWAGPAASLVVGLGGLAGGSWIAVSGRKAERLLAAGRYEHEARATHAQWHRDHRAEAYIDLLEMAEEIGQWVATVYPMWDTDPPRPLQEIPALTRQAQVRARFTAFATPAVRQHADAWYETAGKALRAAEAVARAETGARQQLDELRGSERTAREQMAAAVAEDLQSAAGRDPGAGTP